MFIPTSDAHIDMTSTEFEKYSLEILNEQLKSLENVKFEHDKIIQVSDGNYQIDVYIEFQLMGVKFKVIVECKHYSSPISREKVQVLYGKICSLGAQKGILIASSNFQSGAIEYAKQHGIALIQITDAGMQYEIRSRVNVIMNAHNLPYNNGKPYIEYYSSRETLLVLHVLIYGKII